MKSYFGEQSKKMFRNMGKVNQLFDICNTRVRENPKHVIFQCPGLEPFRAIGWRQVVSSMPPAIAREMERMDHDRKLELIASGLGGSYFRRWDGIYFLIVSFVHDMSLLWDYGRDYLSEISLCTGLSNERQRHNVVSHLPGACTKWIHKKLKATIKLFFMWFGRC